MAAGKTPVVSIVRLVRQWGARMTTGIFGRVLAACGSPTTASLPRPVNACSPMSPSEAAPIFAGAGSHCPQLHASDDTQSYCSYPGSTEGTSVLANGTMETNRSSKGLTGSP